MELNEVYSWTDTNKNWKNLLKKDINKTLIIETWADLVEKKLWHDAMTGRAGGEVVKFPNSR